MTIGDWPAELAVGYFLNQNMLHEDDVVTGIDHDELGVVIVRTERETDFEAKMKRKIRTRVRRGTAWRHDGTVRYHRRTRRCGSTPRCWCR